jgi:hypothetical protein
MHLRFLGDTRPLDEKFVVLNRLPSKVVNLHNTVLQKVIRDTDEHDRQHDEKPTLFHVLNTPKQRSTRAIRRIQDEQGQTQNAQLPIMRVFMTHFRKKYDVIEVEDACINAMADAIPQPIDMTYREHLERPKDMDEICQVMLVGKRQKAPGSDGMSLEFYKIHSTTIKDDTVPP